MSTSWPTLRIYDCDSNETIGKIINDVIIITDITKSNQNVNPVVFQLKPCGMVKNNNKKTKTKKNSTDSSSVTSILQEASDSFLSTWTFSLIYTI